METEISQLSCIPSAGNSQQKVRICQGLSNPILNVAESRLQSLGGEEELWQEIAHQAILPTWSILFPCPALMHIKKPSDFWFGASGIQTLGRRWQLWLFWHDISMIMIIIMDKKLSFFFIHMRLIPWASFLLGVLTCPQSDHSLVPTPSKSCHLVQCSPIGPLASQASSLRYASCFML